MRAIRVGCSFDTSAKLNVVSAKGSLLRRCKAYTRNHELLASHIRLVSRCVGRRSSSACRILSSFGVLVQEGTLTPADCVAGVATWDCEGVLVPI